MESPDLDKLHILIYPHSALRKRCSPVDIFDENLAQLIKRMFELMHIANGVGLAAPQVGILKRLFVCNPTSEPADDTVWINPTLSNLEGMAEADEGCLSLPGVNVPKRRAIKVTIEGQDIFGQPVQADGQDLLARIWQHENDHLDGRLVIDGMSEAAELANRRTVRQLEADFAAAKR